MSDQDGRHAADSGGQAPAEEAFARPPGVADGFEPRRAESLYTPPPPTVSPQEQAVFGRPRGAGEFEPLPGERLPPHRTEVAPVPRALTESFGPAEGAVDGFDPAPGTRLDPSGRRAESPWWKKDAQRDPWRDPKSPFWLGRGAVFTGGRPAQVNPDEDAETDDDLVVEPPAEDEPAAVTTKFRVGLRAVVFMAIIGLVAGGLGGGVGYWLTKHARDALHRSDVSLAKTGTPANRPPGSIADIAKRVGPAVVSIAVTTPRQYAVGSGVVFEKHGYVLTNNHVVADAASGDGTIVVTFADEATAKAQIVGRDPTSDLAVLKVPDDQLTIASLGDSDKLAVGDPVIAIGSPLDLQGTVTEGIVSALQRAVAIPTVSGEAIYIDAIQTDAAINHGNSGGALVDASGAVVGINSAAAFGTTDPNGQQSSVSGIGFAIPINYARGIAQQLIAKGKAVHASLGAHGRSATANDGLDQGAYLEQVVPSGAAAKAGLRNGDVVVAADGKPIVSYPQLVVIVQAHKPKDTISVTYFRGSAKKTAQITLDSD
ncbi:MAG: Serine protease, subfamily, contains C-terminal domain [Pseudonocardiales bacterium]|nr:Serine protease, subfamily, contains C-terminal domain [Pseudonocardiales bacterium]